MFRNGLWNVAFPLCSHSCSLFPYQARESKKVLRDGAFFATRERVSKNSLDTERSPNWSEHDMSSTMFGLHWTVQTGCPFLNENWKTDPFIIILSQNYCLVTTVCILVRYLRPARTPCFFSEKGVSLWVFFPLKIQWWIVQLNSPIYPRKSRRCAKEIGAWIVLGLLFSWIKSSMNFKILHIRGWVPALAHNYYTTR